MFFVEDEAENTPSTPSLPAAPAQQKSSAPLQTATPSNSEKIISSGAALDQRIFDSLQKALEESNLAGFDYFEFKAALKSLEGIIPEESVRFRSAFATAQAMGLTLPKLVESCLHYKNILLNEQKEFTQALEGQIDKGLKSKQLQVESTEGLIAQKQAEIARLTQEIETHKQEITAIRTEVAEVEQRIGATKSNFEFTLQTVLGELEKDAASISRFLKS